MYITGVLYDCGGTGGLKLVADVSLMLLQLRLCKSTVKLILRGTQEPNGGSITWCVVDGRVLPPAPHVTRDVYTLLIVEIKPVLKKNLSNE